MASTNVDADERRAAVSIREVLLLGSTGSIGTQALDVVRDNPDRFRVTGLAAGGSDLALLVAQATEFRVPVVAVADASKAAALTEALRAAGSPATVLAGADAATDIVEAASAHTVLNGITGSRGLKPTLAALASGATCALANKESLVAGGSLVTRAARPGQLVPVDSEHSALAQCLRGGRADEVDRLVLTASGGPFRGRRRADLEHVTLDDALKHPTWDMGPVVTINSATLVNKGLELIEAHLLFGVPYDRIDVVVHPQSIIHSMVTFCDGSTLAQASPPDMRLPIALALGWPDRVPNAAPACAFDTAGSWTFEPLDHQAFPGVTLARTAGEAGGCLPAMFNAANEEAVAAFVRGEIGFTDITDLVERVLTDAHGCNTEPATVDDVLTAEEFARSRAGELVNRLPRGRCRWAT